MSQKNSSTENNQETRLSENKRDYDNSPYTYAVLMETSGEDAESWYYFIRHEGNEEELKHLENQLDSIEWYNLDDLNTFVLERQILVSEKTAKEMTKIDLNSQSFHRKFDGKLKRIDFKLKDRYSNEKKMDKVFDVLGYGRIEDYISDEDIDPEDLLSHSEEDSSEEETQTDSLSDSSSDNDKKKMVLPTSMTRNARNNLPRHKRHIKRKH